MAAFDPAAALPCSSRGWVSVIVAPDEPHASRADPRRGGKPAVVAGAESPPRASGEGITGTDGSAAVLLGVLRSPWPRLAVFVVLGVGAGWLTLTQGAAVVVETRGWVAGLGAAGVVAFVVIYAGATVALLPVSLLSAAAGVLFGPLVGVGAVWAGAMLGAAASFGLGRVLSRAAVEALAGPRIEALDRFLARNGLWAVLLVRLIPLFPFTLVNHGSAATAIRPRHYLAGTAAGIVPGVVVYVALGGTVDDPTSPEFLAAAAGFVVLTLGGLLVARRWRHRNPADHPADHPADDDPAADDPAADDVPHEAPTSPRE